MRQSVSSVQYRSYPIEVIREEATHLVLSGRVSRQQPLYVLCNYIPTREWNQVEQELEKNSFLLRDRIGDLMSREYWEND